MIRTERLSVATEDFASERKQILTRTEESMRDAVEASLRRIGLPGWESNIVYAALDVFEVTASAEAETWTQVLDDLRAEFQRALSESLEKTKRSEDFARQAETITRWVSVMSVNAGTEAAATADPDGSVGLEWITMGDSHVRDAHKDANGQTVPSGQEFNVGGVDMLYPGEPKGDPSNWLNCRCVVRPVALSGFTATRSEADVFAGATAPLSGRLDGVPVGVSIGADSGSSGNGAGGSPREDILSVRDISKVGRPDTKGDFANVVDDLTGPDSVFQPPRNSMRSDLAAEVVDPEGAVLGLSSTALVAGRDPKPAGVGLVDLGPEAVFKGEIPSSHTPSVPVTKPGNASDPGTDGDKPSAAVVVLLPRAGDPVTEIASGTDPHQTLLYLGDGDIDLTDLNNTVKAAAAAFGRLITDKVSGRAVLGKDNADVLLLDASGSSLIREWLLEEEPVPSLLGMQEQFPAWIPHVTLGYPEAPSTGDELPEDVTFDRLAVWRGDETYEFPLTAEEAPVADQSLTAAAAEIDPDEFDEALAALDGEEYPEIPIHGVLAPEGTESGDGRAFGDEGLTHRPLPIPMKFMWEDAEGHMGSYPVGKITRMSRRDGLIWFEGVMDTSAQAYEAVRVIANEIMNGVSVDVDAATAYADEDDNVVFSSARISAATICAIPAFAEAFVALGPLPEVEAEPDVSRETESVELAAGTAEFDLPPQKTKDGPGWITDPKPTKQITGYWVDGRGAAKIGWGTPGDFNRCRAQLGKYVTNPDWLAGLCANLHYRALGAWPGKASGGAVEMNQTITASAGVTFADADTEVLSADLFTNPELVGPTPFTVTDDGHVFGHIATWGVCHIAVAESCVTAPHSATNYAYFLTGEVQTDAGPVAVGQISMGGGHADLRYGVRPAIAHYDSTSTAVADVTVGEDSFGIWVSGALRGDLSAEERRALRAAAISGDWRGVRKTDGSMNRELVAALAVNVPGFPIPRTAFATKGAEPMSLVAAAIPQPGDVIVSDDAIAEGVERYFAKRERAAKLSALQANVRSRRFAAAKSKLSK